MPKLPKGTSIVCKCGLQCKVSYGTIHECPAYNSKKIWNLNGVWEDYFTHWPVDPNVSSLPKHGDKTLCPGCNRDCIVNIDSMHSCPAVNHNSIFCNNIGQWVFSDSRDPVPQFQPSELANSTIIYSWDFAWH